MAEDKCCNPEEFLSGPFTGGIGERAGKEQGSFFATNKCRFDSYGLVRAHTLVPFVKLRFKNSNGAKITVGNESSDKSNSGACESTPLDCMPNYSTGGSYSKKNHASVTHFQYGFSGPPGHGGDGISVEITDEDGGDFCNFMTNIMPNVRNPEDIAKHCEVQFQFGWITQDCNGVSKYFASQVRQCFAFTVDVSFQGGGVIKYTINGVHPAEAMAAGPNDTRNTEGSDLSPIELKIAIKNKMAKFGMDVEFPTALKEGNISCQGTGGSDGYFLTPSPCKAYKNYGEWEFKGNYKWKDTWHDNNKDPISALEELLKDKMTTNDKNFHIATCNMLSNRPKIMIWESSLPDCKGNTKLPNIGTFIVNGGQCSNVLEFKPQIQYIITNLAQGGGIDQKIENVKGQDTSQGSIKKQTCGVSGHGTKQITTVSDPARNEDPKNALHKTTQAFAAAARALTPTAPIQAELVLQGVECLDDTVQLCAGHECTIIVINPFYIEKKADCKDWLMVSGFNGFLSSCHWFIAGVSHEIREGSFTTTLKVMRLTDAPSLVDDAVAVAKNNAQNN